MSFDIRLPFRTFSPACYAVLAFWILPGSLPGQSGGLTPEWDVQKDLAALSSQVKRLKPILDQLKPEDWVAKGAPHGYVAQWKSSRTAVDALGIASSNLAQEPEKLSTALDALFRMQGLETSLMSLAGGIRRYQNPALADLLQGVLSESSASRDTLRQYVLDLANLKEQEFRIMDQEAQRCRGSISRTAAAPRKTEQKRGDEK